ncbi:GcrA family cell cycle regulator [Methylosinus sp. Ce-a6]|uniref:GcrA family cell cycle regulator n=1 Tax=Methylosinus sp. Ce-a6 TaxID=2172005 RepID=UPI00135B442B|nr:GcrA family cell cycle regulator [Methylosinus sp. Ce-a6]
MADFNWTPAAIEALRRLVKDGESSGYAAEALSREFGGYATRNAVVGKATRLGLHFHSVQNTRKIRRAKKPVSLAATEPAPQPTASSEPARLEPTHLPTIAMSNPIAPRVPPEKALAAPAPVIAPIADVAIQESKRVKLFDLTDGACRWPIGTPGSDDFHFCGAGGASLAAGRPYCGQHARIGYTTPEKAKRASAEWREKHRKAARAA